jgi:hypothetical protein
LTTNTLFQTFVPIKSSFQQDLLRPCFPLAKLHPLLTSTAPSSRLALTVEPAPVGVAGGEARALHLLEKACSSQLLDGYDTTTALCWPAAYNDTATAMPVLHRLTSKIRKVAARKTKKLTKKPQQQAGGLLQPSRPPPPTPLWIRGQTPTVSTTPTTRSS